MISIRLATCFVAAGAALMFAGDAQAVPILLQRCSNDSLDPGAAKLRLEWARTCALTLNTNGPNDKEDFGEVDSSGNILWEYMDDNNPSKGYTGLPDVYINYTFRDKLYTPFGTKFQSLDANGFHKWTKSTQRIRPFYPTFGTSWDISSGAALWPHPQLQNCNLYPNKTGSGLPATAYYVNGYCESSCYTPEQEVLFPDGYHAIKEAMDALLPDMVTLTPDSTRHDIALQSNGVHSYTSEIRDTTNVIFEIETDSGPMLRVTNQHPVIRGGGKLVQAESLKVGDDLVKADGSLAPIIAITKKTHRGKVYNIRPVSHDPVSNILVAQGYLVGSANFQNDDIEYINRIILGRGIPEHVIPR